MRANGSRSAKDQNHRRLLYKRKIIWFYNQMVLKSNHRSQITEALGKLITNAQSATHAVDEVAALWLGVNRTDLRCLGVLIERSPLSASSLAKDVGLSKAR